MFLLLSLYKPGALSDGYTRLKSIFYRQPNRKTAAKLKTKNVYEERGNSPLSLVRWAILHCKICQLERFGSREPVNTHRIIKRLAKCIMNTIKHVVWAYHNINIKYLNVSTCRFSENNEFIEQI